MFPCLLLASFPVYPWRNQRVSDITWEQEARRRKIRIKTVQQEKELQAFPIPLRILGMVIWNINKSDFQHLIFPPLLCAANLWLRCIACHRDPALCAEINLVLTSSPSLKSKSPCPQRGILRKADVKITMGSLYFTSLNHPFSKTKHKVQLPK